MRMGRQNALAAGVRGSAIRAVLLISAAAPSPLSGATKMVWGRRRNFRIEFLKIWNGATGALLIEHIAKNPDEVFPRVYPLVARAAQHGDEVSRKILDSAVDALVELADHVIRELGLTGEKFPLVRAGGVFGHCAYLDALVDLRLAAIAGRATIGPLQTSPAEAAAQMARTAAGRAADAN